MGRTSASLLLLSVPALAQTGEPHGTWVPRGTGGGGHICRIAFHPTDPHTFWVGTDVGGVFRTTDDGATWTASTVGLSSDYIRDLAVDPDDPDRLFAATEAGVSRSLDGGATWSTVAEAPLPQPPGVPKKFHSEFASVSIDPFPGDVVWASIGRFRFSTWAGTGEYEPDDLEAQWPHVWRSEDGGATFAPVDPILVGGQPLGAGVHSIEPVIDLAPWHPGAEIVLATTTDGVFVGLLYQGTWFWLDYTANLPHRDARDLELSFDPETGLFERCYVVLDTEWDGVDPNSVYDVFSGSGHGGGVWWRGSPAAPWAPAFRPGGNDGLELHDGDFVRPKNMRHIALDRERGHLYLALTWRRKANEGVYRAPIDQIPWSWQHLSRSGTVFDPPNIEFDYFPTIGDVDLLGVDPHDGDVLFGTNQALYRCEGGACVPDIDPGTWKPLHTEIVPDTPDRYRAHGLEVTGTRATVVDPSDPDVWLIALYDWGVLRSDDRGDTWRPIGDPLDVPYSAYEGRSCIGLFPNPDPSDDEWIGLFGQWKPLASEGHAVFELWRTSGTPSDASVWEPLTVTSPERLYVRDVLYLDGSHLVVASESGIWSGTKTAGTWSFQPDAGGISGASLRALALSAGPGEGPNRRTLVATRVDPGSPTPYGGVWYRDTWQGPWTAGVLTSGPNHGLSNVFALEWSRVEANRVYAGGGPTALGGAVGGVLVSEDGGANWAMTTQTGFDPGFLPPYDPLYFDVLGLATVPWPTANGVVDRVYAGIAPRGGPDWASHLAQGWGGVFHSDDAGASWTADLAGLDSGYTIYLDTDPTDELRLHYGVKGNGSSSMRLADRTSAAAARVEEAARLTTGSGSSFGCTQQIVNVGVTVPTPSQPLVRRAFLDFDLSSVPDGATVLRAELEVGIFDGAQHAGTSVAVRSLPAPASVLSAGGCDVLFGAVDGAPTYASHSGWTGTGTAKRFDLGSAAVTDVQAALAADVFSLGLRFVDESAAFPDIVEIHGVNGSLAPRLHVTWTQP